MSTGGGGGLSVGGGGGRGGGELPGEGNDKNGGLGLCSGETSCFSKTSSGITTNRKSGSPVRSRMFVINDGADTAPRTSSALSSFNPRMHTRVRPKWSAMFTE